MKDELGTGDPELRTRRTELSARAGILVGTCSWTDPTLFQSGWYPASASTAETRLAFYARSFSIVEVDASYYAMPSARNAALWVQRTPADFVFNFKAYSLMTGHGTTLAKLPAPVRDSLPADFHTDRKQVYLQHLPEPAQRWIWDAFEQALEPLWQAGKLGVVLFQFPPWFHMSRQNMGYIEHCRRMMPQHRLAVEFRNGSWLEERNAPETMNLLKDHGLTYVCVDEPPGFRSSVPPVTAVTNPALAVVRFHGRNAENWQASGITVAERFKYLYSEPELAEWAPRIQELAAQADQTHVLFNNCYSDYGVRNAAQLSLLLDLAR